MAAWHFDRTGFPYLEVHPRLAVGLLPVAVVQAEAFLGGSPGVDPATAEGVLGLEPRATWRAINPDRFENLFALGVAPAAGERLAQWLGPKYRLPTPAEWVAADAAVAARPDAGALSALASNAAAHPAARAVLRRLLDDRPPASWPRATLFADGFLEWVALPHGKYRLHGRPRPNPFHLIHNPQIHEPVNFRQEFRHRSFALRLVRHL